MIQHTNILVVEDREDWQEIVCDTILAEGHVPYPALSCQEALDILDRQKIDLAVIDLSLASSLEPQSNQDGYRLLANQKMAGIPTIVVSGYANPALIEEAYAEFGLLACLEKQSFSRETFLSTVAEAQSHKQETIPFQNLTKREREVLGLLTRGYTNKMIAQHIHVSPNTVKRHLKSIFVKLKVKSRAAATAKAVSAGIFEE